MSSLPFPSLPFPFFLRPPLIYHCRTRTRTISNNCRERTEIIFQMADPQSLAFHSRNYPPKSAIEFTSSRSAITQSSSTRSLVPQFCTSPVPPAIALLTSQIGALR
jgi:hypothetical protein